MKWILLIVLMSCKIGFSQDTLRHLIPRLGYEDFILYDNNSFQYHSSQCGHEYYSFGTYQKSKKKINFFPDSSFCPKSSFEIIDCNSEKDSLVVKFYDFIDSNQIDFWGESFFFGEKRFKITDLDIIIPKSEIHSNQFRLHYFGKRISLNIPVETFTDTVQIYIPPISMNYNCGENTIRQLPRKKGKYFYKKTGFVDGKKVTTKYYFKNLTKSRNQKYIEHN